MLHLLISLSIVTRVLFKLQKFTHLNSRSSQMAQNNLYRVMIDAKEQLAALDEQLAAMVRELAALREQLAYYRQCNGESPNPL